MVLEVKKYKQLRKFTDLATAEQFGEQLISIARKVDYETQTLF